LGLFDPRPKDNLRDFFDRECELHEFGRSIDYSPLTLVLGLRRYGKTSLILTGLNMKRVKYVYIDCKSLPAGMIGVSDFTQLLVYALNNFVRRYRRVRSLLLKLLKGIRGVSISGFGISINLRRFQTSSLVELISKLDELGERVILVIDEAQELRRLARYRVDYLLSYIYDNFRNVGIVLSGSQVGLLYRLLRVNDPNAPLYGRAYTEIKLRRLPKEQSREFLELGFKEYNLKPPEDLIEYIVNAVDGVIGWLAYIGFKIINQRTFTRGIVDRVLSEACKLALEELEHFLSLRPLARERYINILKAIAILDRATWSNIYNYTQAKIGRIPKPTFNTLLRNLIDAGFIEKERDLYIISDPILKRALKR